LQNIVSFIGLFCKRDLNFKEPENRNHPITHISKLDVTAATAGGRCCCFRVYTCIYIYIYIHVQIYHIYIYICIYIHRCVHMHINNSQHTSIQKPDVTAATAGGHCCGCDVYIYIYMYIYTSMLYTYTCIHICMYIHMYNNEHTSLRKSDVRTSEF